MRVVIIIGILFAAMLLAGCTEEADTKRYLPQGSENITHLGEGWLYFELDLNDKRQCFLINRVMRGFAITQVTC